MSYTHYTIEERFCLYELKLQGKNHQEIALELGKSESSVGRELKRNANCNGKYNPCSADRKATRRRRESYKCKLEKHDEMREYVIEKLGIYWSPETISTMWNMGNIGNRITFSTIYRAIKRKKLPRITEKTHLRRRGKSKYVRANSATIKPDHTIHERPSEVQWRLRNGDFEGDTVVGAEGCVVTNVDRKSRYLLAKLAKNRKKGTIKKAMLESFQGHKVETLTLDNGSEFALHREISEELDAPIYFCDPRSPWQRGTNENMNGLLRFFYPKGTNFLEVSEEDFNKTIDLINSRPRKCLGWRTPADVYLHFI